MEGGSGEVEHTRVDSLYRSRSRVYDVLQTFLPLLTHVLYIFHPLEDLLHCRLAEGEHHMVTSHGDIQYSYTYN